MFENIEWIIAAFAYMGGVIAYLSWKADEILSITNGQPVREAKIIDTPCYDCL
ncbi:hypothetical protein AAC978_04590 [Desulfitobacterium sp. THU1]|uniref:hypothetical protein n=1 Tax=Desulfitobacterium sp. THU1 TaxID=3138072 RepID=UPI00311F87E0